MTYNIALNTYEICKNASKLRIGLHCNYRTIIYVIVAMTYNILLV